MNRLDSPYEFRSNRFHQANRINSIPADSCRFGFNDWFGPIYPSVKANPPRSVSTTSSQPANPQLKATRVSAMTSRFPSHSLAIITNLVRERCAVKDPSDPVHRDKDAIHTHTHTHTHISLGRLVAGH